MQQPLSFYEARFTGIFEKGLIEEIAKIGSYMEVSEGHVLMRPGGYIRSVPIILEGSVKILRADEDGREALLYYLGEVDSCAMSLTCCLGRRQSEIMAVVEEKTQLILIPVEKVDEWMCRFQTWKQFVFNIYQRRFEDMLTTIDNVAFRKMDERVLYYLQQKVQSCNCAVISITHEEIANEMATSREVVSRLLKQLERLGKVKLSRNKIEML
ncbi:MAG: Crp/Fnr family transcriptional regulator [Spirosomataceae bacterium]